LSDPEFEIDPTDEDVAAIVAVLFGERAETIQNNERTDSAWALAGRMESVEKWMQRGTLSRLRSLRELK
jgi:hypothetical protein